MPSKHEAPNPIQVQKYLGGLDYPAKKQDIVQKARQKGADHDILQILQKIPDQEYASPVALSREVSKIH
ncbi:MAG TPA: DUF2795 domain-containing protein [Azonexus sp.]|nr:DUF2795 domain-containing protein [Azonexus sp.]